MEELNFIELTTCYYCKEYWEDEHVSVCDDSKGSKYHLRKIPAEERMYAKNPDSIELTRLERLRGCERIKENFDDSKITPDVMAQMPKDSHLIRFLEETLGAEILHSSLTCEQVLQKFEKFWKTL